MPANPHCEAKNIHRHGRSVLPFLATLNYT